jgi:putative FmdB family regulatory protein
MPTYEYRCPQGHEFELFQKMSDPPKAKCPRCGKMATRVISGGAGLIFKGTGFYITDYGKDGKGPKKAETETSTPSATPASSGSSTEAPAAKSEPAAGETKPQKAEKSRNRKPST